MLKLVRSPWSLAWILVDDLNQLAHAVQAVAHHLRGFAARGGHQFVADHQQAKVATRQKALHHDLAMVGGGAEGFVKLCAGCNVDRHTLALVAVLRFDHHRQADLLGCGPCVVSVSGWAT